MQNIKGNIPLFWAKVKKSDGCWEWQGAKSDFGHGRFRVSRKKEHRAHRFSWMIENNSEIPDGMVVCHKCDNPPCVRPDHLFLGTMKDNTQDMLLKKREIRGSKAPWSKVTPEQVKAILLDTRAQHVIGKEYGLKQQSISSIKLRKNWRVIE